MSTDELYATLNAKLPREAIATRQQAGTTLAYIEAWYAIDMANQIFGHLNWDKHIHHLNMVDLEEVEGARGKQWRCYYTCHLRVHVRHENQVKFTDDVGYGSGISKHKGDAIEGAVKEAVSDAVKRCLKDLGYQFGLALYDKEKKGVETREEAEEKKAEPVAVAAAPASAESDPPPIKKIQPPPKVVQKAPAEPDKPLKDTRTIRRIEEFQTPALMKKQMRDIFWEWMRAMQEYKKVLGHRLYYEILSRYKLKKSNQVDYTHPDGQRQMLAISKQVRGFDWIQTKAYYHAAYVTYEVPNMFNEILDSVNDSVEDARMISDEQEQRTLVKKWSDALDGVDDGKIARVVDIFDAEVLKD